VPSGIGVRILLQPTNPFPIECEVNLPQTTLGSPTNRVTFFAYLDGLGSDSTPIPGFTQPIAGTDARQIQFSFDFEF
jgi:hypothetical protein